MTPPDELLRENEMLRERLALMGQASLRINESLDSAQSLTGARYGAITLFDDSVNLMDLLFSGVPPQVAQRFHELQHPHAANETPPAEGRGQRQDDTHPVTPAVQTHTRRCNFCEPFIVDISGNLTGPQPGNTCAG